MAFIILMRKKGVGVTGVRRRIPLVDMRGTSSEWANFIHNQSLDSIRLARYPLFMKTGLAQLVSLGLTPSEIGRRLGLSRQRIHQRLIKEGLVAKRRLRAFPKKVSSTCKRCGKVFPFMKLHRKHTRAHCSDRCWKIIKLQKVCYVCHSKKGLVKAGKNNLGSQKYVCTPCRQKS